MSFFQEFMAYVSAGFWILPAYIVAMIVYHLVKPNGFDWETTPIFGTRRYAYQVKTRDPAEESHKTPDFGQVTRDGWGCLILKTDEVPKTKDGETIH